MGRLTFLFKKSEYEGSARVPAIFYVGAVLIILILIGGLIHARSSYGGYDVVSSIDKTDNVSVNYQMMGKGLLRYSKDGVSYSKTLDKMLWNQSFEMASGRAVTRGDYLAIGDIGSNEIRIFDKNGQVGIVTTSHPIDDLDVAAQGVVAAALSEAEMNYIFLYDSKGNVLAEIRTGVERMGFILDFALAPEGDKVAVSYLKMASEGMTSTLVIYDFGSSGENAIDHIVGTFEYEMIIPRLTYMDKSTLCAVGESSLILYDTRYSPELVEQVDFDREIRSVFMSDKYLGFVFRNNMEPDEDGHVPDGKYHMEVYTTAGRLYMEQDFDFDYETITATDREILMYSDDACVIFTYTGKEKFSYTFDEPIIRLLPKGTADTYIYIGRYSIEEIRLR